MKVQSRLGPTATMALRFFVGGGWLLVGIATVFAPISAYLPGDQRGGPFFWPAIGLVTALAGFVIVGYAIRDLRRRRRASSPGRPAPSSDIRRR
jgi:hypothetical protein